MSLCVEWPLRKISEPHESNDVLLDDSSSDLAERVQGNQRLWELVRSRKEDYATKSRIEKPLVAIEILKAWRNQEPPPGRFLVEEPGSHPPLFKDVGDKKARNYISKLLKDAIDNNHLDGHDQSSQGHMKRGQGQHSRSQLDWGSVASKLYEREEHAGKLRDAFERSRLPDFALSAELVLINGPSGSGKTSLAHSMKEFAIQEGGFYIWGKYDQLRHKSKAYSAFFDAFYQLVKLLQMRDEAWKDKVKSHLHTLVGPELQVLVEAMPFLESFLVLNQSLQSTSNCSGNEKSKKRFLVAFRRFVRALLDPKYPLVLCLDDIQWADPGSLDLLHSLVSPQFGCRKGLLIVATCRGNEVSLGDLLSVHLRQLEEEGTTITSIEVANLTVATLAKMISDAGMPKEQSSELAEIVHMQTKGNAFFSTQYLQNLQEEGLLKRQSSDAEWEFNEDELQLSSHSTGYDTQMVRLLAKKMMQLPNDVQEVLKVAACIGSDVLEEILFHASSVASSTVLLALSVLEEKGIIVYNFDNGRGRFAHDRFQEAAVSLIPPDQQQLFQLQIGMALRTQLSEEEFTKQIPLITTLMIQGVDHMEDEDEREKLARLCLIAARTVARASAFNAAIHYIEFGMTLLSSRHWRDQYDLSLRIYSMGCELAFCNGDHSAVERMTEEVVRNARSFKDTVNVHVSLILSLDSRWKFEEASDVCFKILDHCGERFPRKVGKTGMLLDFLKTRRMLKGKTAHDILNLPPMTDSNALTAMSVIHLLYTIVLLHNFALSPLTAFRLVRLTLRHGMSPMSSVGFAFYASVLVRLKRVDDGFFYAKLALQITKKYPVKEFEARTSIAVWNNVMTEVESLSKCREPCLAAHHTALSTGDFNSAMAALFCNCLLRFLTGDTLASVTEALNHGRQLAKDYNQLSSEAMSDPVLQICYNLMGLSDDPFVLSGEAMDEDSWKAKTSETDTSIHAFLAILKLLMAIYMNKKEQEFLQEFRKQDPGIVIPYLYNYTTFFEGLVEASRPSRWSQWRARRNLRYLEKAMLRCPENYANKVFLIRAQLASTAGRHEHALIAFDKAIHYAATQGWVHEQALANEKAAKMLLSSGQACDAKHYFEEAIKCYREWGAEIKVLQLESLIANEK